MSVKTTDVEGDVSVGRHVAVGGDVKVEGDALLKGNVRVEGWLEAPNVRVTAKGLFRTVEELRQVYPRPQHGWWAVVGDTVPGPVYVGWQGEWVATGKTGGGPTLDVPDWALVGDVPMDGVLYGRRNREWEKVPLDEIMNVVFPLGWRSFEGGGVYEKGSEVTPKLAWTLERKGQEVTAERVTVNGSEAGVAENRKGWTGTPTREDFHARVEVTEGGQTLERSADFVFRLKKYWGVSASENLTAEEVLKLAGSGWATGREMGKTRFDCTGGKYPWYVLEKRLAAGVEMWVNGFKNTDVVKTDVELTNTYGVRETYEAIRLNNIQTGVLEIEFR